MHTSVDATFSESFGVSQADRARSKVERQATTEMRAFTLFRRTADAARRDQQASLRDVEAAARDRTAELRDRALEDDEGASAPADASPSSARVTAAADRARAAEDRGRAAADRKRAAEDRKQARVDLDEAELDDLTGFHRLGLGRAVLQREIDRIQRSGGRLVIAYCDVDGLKQVNDQNGHAAGDALLKSVADAIRSRLRSYDPVVRVGGDEFVCALSEVDLERATGIFHEVQEVLAQERAGASISFGLAALRADDSLATLLERSDQALRERRVASRESSPA